MASLSPNSNGSFQEWKIHVNSKSQNITETMKSIEMDLNQFFLAHNVVFGLYPLDIKAEEYS